jgi:hypothetical protein
MIYLAEIPMPEDVPAGTAIVHNHAKPAKRIGRTLGFRVWAQALNDDRYAPIEPCSCTWAPELGRHYRVKRETHPACSGVD